jgi:hypothetical protein
MSLRRVAGITPAANTNTLAFNAGTSYLLSAIITNRDLIKTTNVDVYIVPDGETNPDNYIYIVYKFPLGASNSMETHRFALQPSDTIYVRSTLDDVSFLLEGIPQQDPDIYYSVGNSFPATPSVGELFFKKDTDQFYVYTSGGWGEVSLTLTS